MSARNRLYEQAADFARRAIELDSTSWRGFALLGINQLRNGKMGEGRLNLEHAFEGDPYDVWTKNTLDLLDTLEQYPETRTTRFRFVVDGKESQLLSLYLSELAEDAYDRLSAQYGYRPPTPIRVEVFPSHADFSVRTVGLVGLGALGVSFGPVVAMDSPSARKIGEFNWGSVLWHELAHTFHLSMSDHKVPRWFTEGLAVFEERRARPGWGDDVSPGFLAAYRQGRLLAVSELNNGFMRPAYPQQVGYSYYQASLVCELIERDYGFQAIVDILAGYGAGQSTTEIFRSVLGIEIDRFDRTFDRYMRERFAAPLAAMRPGDSRDSMPHPSRERMIERAEKDPDDFAAQLAMGRILLGDGRPDAAIPYLERAKSLFPQYAGDDSPYWYLAQIYRERGENRRAAAELTALTAINERHYQARLELADLRLALNDQSGAAEALDAVMYIYPMEMQIHIRLAELYASLARWPRAIRERKAVLALDPVDRAEALYQLAQTHFDAGDLERARRSVLRALERAPNFESAQELLLRIHANRTGREE